MNNSYTDSAVLKATNVTKRFGELTVLDNLNLCLNKGEFISLIGPNGCGKTTLLRILSGLTKDFSGNIQYRINDISRLPCSFVFQNSPLFPWLTVFDNLKICINRRSISKEEKHELALNYLAKVGLSGFKDYFPGEISGGMVQRVNLARSFVSNSEIIFMDEPFVHLDFLQRISLQKITLDILEKDKRSIVFVTHNIYEAVTLADRVVLMSAQPGKNIKEFLIDIPRPRDIEEIREESRYIGLIREIRALLSEEVRKNEIKFNR